MGFSSRFVATAFAVIALVCAGAGTAHAQGMTLAPVGVFVTPVYVTSPPGDQDRLFVVERTGTVRIVKGGIPRPVPFLDVTGQVSQAGEGGLLSIAFPPDHSSTGLVYTYSTPDEDTIRLDEYEVAAGDPDRVDPASRRTVLTIPHPTFTNHYGGQIAFGPDGYLYAAPGDGGGSGDPDDNGQDLSVLLGKLIRIDPRESGGEPYSVPSDNPFVGQAGARPEIFAYGLRNPWRFSFDRLTGDLTIGDVGENSREEVNFAPAALGGGSGANFGWSIWEGTLRFKEGEAPGHVPPVLEYDNDLLRCAVIGGYVVRDPKLAGLAGDYVYGDLCSGEIRAARLQAPQATNDRSLGTLPVPALTSFGEDANGCVYAISLAGPVFRLAPVDGSLPLGGCSGAERPAPTCSLLRVGVGLLGRTIRVCL